GPPRPPAAGSAPARTRAGLWRSLAPPSGPRPAGARQSRARSAASAAPLARHSRHRRTEHSHPIAHASHCPHGALVLVHQAGDLALPARLFPQPALTAADQAAHVGVVGVVLDHPSLPSAASACTLTASYRASATSSSGDGLPVTGHAQL